jgi:hypothetical protein
VPNTPRMKWPFPRENLDPWFDAYVDQLTAQDASGYAHREDRNAFLGGGGTFTFDDAGDSLVWDATLEIYSPISGFRIDVPADTISIEDGQVFYVELTRSPTNVITGVPVVASTIPGNDTAMVIAVRRGANVVFRHGLSLPAGVPSPLFAPAVAPAGPLSIITTGGRESHDSDTPLIVGAFAFTPSIYLPDLTSLVFRAVAANGDIGLTNSVQLYNVTDAELVATLSFTSTSQVKDEVTLTLGSGAGEIDTPEHIYEVRIKLDVASGGPTETIELYSAELRVL